MHGNIEHMWAHETIYNNDIKKKTLNKNIMAQKIISYEYINYEKIININVMLGRTFHSFDNAFTTLI